MKAYKIVVVDNHPMIVKYLQTMLEKEGHIVKTATNGLDALILARSFKPDVMLIDMIMPHINGDRLCRILRGFDDLKDTLLIIVSGIAAESEQLYLENIADVLIAKGPFKEMSVKIKYALKEYSEGNISLLKGKVLGIEDIYHREITSELLFAQKHLEVLLTSMQDGVLEFLDDFRIVFVNKAAEKIFNKQEIRLLSQDIRQHIPKEFHRDITQYVENNEFSCKVLGDDISLVLNDSFFHLTLLVVSEPPNKSFLAVFRDVTPHKKMEMELKQSLEMKETLFNEMVHMAATDHLTKLYNRTKIDESLNNELNRGMRYDNHFGIMLMDIDHFKRVNDEYGHLIGDQILIELATLLKNNMRVSDLIGRWGGEEFLIICLETKSVGLLKKAEQLLRTIQKHKFPVVKSLTASFGITVFQPGDEIKTLIARADTALYKAKNEGRNRIEMSV